MVLTTERSHGKVPLILNNTSHKILGPVQSNMKYVRKGLDLKLNHLACPDIQTVSFFPLFVFFFFGGGIFIDHI